MKHAEQFLPDTVLRIEEVGERIGYHSEAAFVRRFTRHFRITPGKPRKLGRGGCEDAGSEPF